MAIPSSSSFDSAVSALAAALQPQLLPRPPPPSPLSLAARVAAGVAAVERVALALPADVDRAAALELALRVLLHERLLDEVRARLAPAVPRNWPAFSPPEQVRAASFPPSRSFADRTHRGAPGGRRAARRRCRERRGPHA